MKRASGWIVLATAAMIMTAVLRKVGDVPTVANGEATDGAFRDGLYLGNLAAANDEISHITLGRSASTSDRQSFAAGYERAYGERTANASQQSPAATNARPTNAAYRDGLYHGMRDAEQGRPVHVAIGRWSQAEDRDSFEQDYRQAHQATLAAREDGLGRLPPASVLQ